jgi:hypothetical protein
VECFSNDYKSEMPDSSCDIKSKPETTQVCTKDCPEITDEWKITSVAEVIKTCFCYSNLYINNNIMTFY